MGNEKKMIWAIFYLIRSYNDQNMIQTGIFLEY